MDVSGETADLIVREGIQVTEAAVKLAGSGVKNVTALMLALAKQDFKVSGRTSAYRLAQDNAPDVVILIKKTDLERFKKLAKDFGILYFIAQKKGNESGIVNIISNQNYAAKLNAVMEQMGYPIPQKAREEEPSKKARPRAPQERSFSERGNGSNPTPTNGTEAKPESPTKKRLERMKRLAAQSHSEPGINKRKVR